MLGRALTSGGVFFYSVSSPIKGSRREPQVVSFAGWACHPSLIVGLGS